MPAPVDTPRSSTSADRAAAHRNNFDLLRFAFAFIVVLVHAHVLSARSELALLSSWLSADFAVKAFFVVSGFLVFMSLENSRSVGEYFSKRARRIYPAYFTVVVACSLAGVLLTQLPAAEYFSAGLVRYLAANLVFLNFLAPELPGLFQGNPITAVNGALWTLKIEVMFYVSVPVIAWVAARIGRTSVLAGTYVASVVYVLAMDQLAQQTGRSLFIELGRQLPGQLSYFVSGAACYYYADAFRRRGALLASIGLVLLVALPGASVRTIVEPAALGVLVAYLAVGFRYLGNFGRYGDFSYGIYIIHFPVIQALVSLGIFDRGPYAALALAVAIVLALALASWRLVEKPFLKKSSHYVVAAHPAGAS